MIKKLKKPNSYLFFGILGYLVHRKGQLINSREIASEFELCTRTVLRYLIMFQDYGIPLISKRGGDGGYMLTDNFFMESFFFNNEQVETIVNALKGEKFDKEIAADIIKKL